MRELFSSYFFFSFRILKGTSKFTIHTIIRLQTASAAMLIMGTWGGEAGPRHVDNRSGARIETMTTTSLSEWQKLIELHSFRFSGNNTKGSFLKTPDWINRTYFTFPAKSESSWREEPLIMKHSTYKVINERKENNGLSIIDCVR